MECRLCRCVPCFSSIVVDNVYKYNNQQHVNFPHSGFINSFDGSFRTLTGMDETLYIYNEYFSMVYNQDDN